MFFNESFQDALHLSRCLRLFLLKQLINQELRQVDCSLRVHAGDGVRDHARSQVFADFAKRLDQVETLPLLELSNSASAFGLRDSA